MSRRSIARKFTFSAPFNQTKYILTNKSSVWKCDSFNKIKKLEYAKEVKGGKTYE